MENTSMVTRLLQFFNKINIQLTQKALGQQVILTECFFICVLYVTEGIIYIDVPGTISDVLVVEIASDLEEARRNTRPVTVKKYNYTNR